MGKSRQVEQYFILHPTATLKEVVEITGVSTRTAQTVKTKLMKAGIIPGSSRVRATENPISDASGAVLSPEVAGVLASPDELDSEIIDDEATQKRMLKEVQNLAFNDNISPDIRMNAMKVWVTIKDYVRAKTLGPGNPLTEEDAITRIIRIMQAAGPKITIQALERAFKMKGTADEETQTEQTGPPEGITQDSDATTDPNHPQTP